MPDKAVPHFKFMLIPEVRDDQNQLKERIFWSSGICLLDDNQLKKIPHGMATLADAVPVTPGLKSRSVMTWKSRGRRLFAMMASPLTR
jgi:hypothetical protein